MNLDDLIGMCSGENAPGESTPGSVKQADDLGLLERNLRALAIRSPAEAELIRRSPARMDLELIETEEAPSATLGGVALGSRRRPLSEARKLAQSVDAESVALAGVVGFALGHHCSALLEHLGPTALLVCFEPDTALLRAVLSRIDCTGLLGSGRFFLVCDPDDSVRVNAVLSGNEALVGMGVRLINHPASVRRIGALGERFGRTLTIGLRAARTHVVTTLANAQTSFRNGLMNLDHYLRSAGIADLRDACVGKPAIVVAAGPSLHKNLDLLADPSVRERFVIVAVQTVLKPMLARGIKPHFVAALDYHEVSGRFYEGLTAKDVEGVRLVVEPKANPVIADAFPGEVLCVRDELLDTLLGPELHRERGELALGATVAHLCYTFARYLGCDPVIFIGQDLGFSDGQYYSSGAAIHNVWGCELSPHRTLEMFEWERVARMRANLHKREDIHGQPIYSDEQMCSYLAQFEGMFAEDTRRGLKIIDASEGGVRKRHTEVMPLREALTRFDSGPSGLPAGRDDRRSRGSGDGIEPRVVDRIEQVVADCERIATISERSLGTLGEMLKHQSDQRRVGKLIGQINRGRDEVMKHRDAFTLVEFVNQIAVLNRMKRDRIIALRSAGADAVERQRMQIERDIENVKWTRDAARGVALQLRDTLAALRGEVPKQTSDRPEPEPHTTLGEAGAQRDRVHALVLGDPERGGLGVRRPLGVRLLPERAGGLNVLQTTIARLDRCTQLDGITIVTPDAEGVRALLGAMPTRHRVDIVEADAGALRGHTARVGPARVQSATGWRGSLGLLGAYDEVCEPGIANHVMQTRGIDAVALVGADWAMVDPALVDATIDRLRRQTGEKRIALSQACPGLGTMAVDRNTMCSLAEARTHNARRNPLATLGALVSYLPTAPQSDPIVRGVCVQIDPKLRDAGVRAIADSATRFKSMRRVYAGVDEPLGADALRCADGLRETKPKGPRTLVLETCTGRLTGGDWGRWKRGSLESVERRPIDLRDAHTLIRSLTSLREDAAVVFDGVGDPLMHPGALDLIALAKEDGAACVELRTDLLREGIETEVLIESGLDVLSVDVIANRADAYRALTGLDGYERVCDRLQAIHDTIAANSAPVWLAARMTRCEQTLDQIEAFYDKWLLLSGAAIIDPLPGFVSNQRIARLPVPSWRYRQMEREIMRVRCDGVVVDSRGRAFIAQGEEVNAIEEGVERALQRVRGAQRLGELELKMSAKEPAA